jgi:predicted amidohydrolase YtcJ
MVGITAATPNPPGGVIQREAGGKTPNGVLEENAHFGVIYTLIPKFTPRRDHRTAPGGRSDLYRQRLYHGPGRQD